VGDDIDSPGL